MNSLMRAGVILSTRPYYYTMDKANEEQDEQQNKQEEAEREKRTEPSRAELLIVIVYVALLSRYEAL